MNQCKYRNKTRFSAKSGKQDEDNQVLFETELFNTLIINHNLTESDIGNTDIKSSLEH